MRSRTLALLAAAAALPAEDAAAETTATVRASPNRPGVPTRLIVEASGGRSSQVIPQGISLLAARGFRFERRAVAQLCEPAQRESCPDGSRIGGGTVEVRVDGPFPGAPGSGVYRGNAGAFLAAAERAGDVAGLVVRLTILGQRFIATGRVTPLAVGPYGLRLALDRIPQAPPLPAGYTVTLEKLHAEVAAHRIVSKTTTRKVRRRGRTVRRKVTRLIRYDLIRTPARCTGQWPVRIFVRYPSGDDVLDTPVACAP